MSATVADPVMPDSAAFAMRLARNIKGEVLFDRASRGRYSTDASIYQMEPVGVIVPETIDDVAAAMTIARDEGVPVLARGGGTSQCGQTVNRALVIDCSKHLRRILHVDTVARTALVEPGLVLGQLNNTLRRENLFFPVDPSTHARCTIGGMAGNNSCGSKSIRYGLMADNVLAIEAILSDGSQHRFGITPDNLGDRHPRNDRRPDPTSARPGRVRSRGNRRPLSPAASPCRRLQHRRLDPRRPGGPAATTWPACWWDPRDAGLLCRDRTDLAPDQAAQGAWDLSVSNVSQGDGGLPAYRPLWTPRQWNLWIGP